MLSTPSGNMRIFAWSVSQNVEHSFWQYENFWLVGEPECSSFVIQFFSSVDGQQYKTLFINWNLARNYSISIQFVVVGEDGYWVKDNI